jgi:hypothetical protein
VKIESVVVGCFDFLKAFLDSLILPIINEISKLVRDFFFEVSHKFSFWSKFFILIFWLWKKNLYFINLLQIGGELELSFRSSEVS